MQDEKQAVPVDRIKGFGEVKLEDQSWLATAVTALNHFRSIDKVLGDGTSTDEAGLINVDQRLDLVLQPCCEDLGEDLDWAILQGYWA